MPTAQELAAYASDPYAAAAAQGGPGAQAAYDLARQAGAKPPGSVRTETVGRENDIRFNSLALYLVGEGALPSINPHYPLRPRPRTYLNRGSRLRALTRAWTAAHLDDPKLGATWSLYNAWLGGYGGIYKNSRAYTVSGPVAIGEMTYDITEARRAVEAVERAAAWSGTLRRGPAVPSSKPPPGAAWSETQRRAAGLLAPAVFRPAAKRAVARVAHGEPEPKPTPVASSLVVGALAIGVVATLGRR